MNTCEETQELIPWYVEGRLGPEESSAVATHLIACAECLREVAATVHVRGSVRDAFSAQPPLPEEAWERVSRQAMGRRLAQLDVGSFLVGLRLGAWLTRRGSPLRADLHVLGREVHLMNRGKKGGAS